jgi:hypothetical protein
MILPAIVVIIASAAGTVKHAIFYPLTLVKCQCNYIIPHFMQKYIKKMSQNCKKKAELA